MKDRIYTAAEILTILDAEWGRYFNLARLGIITNREAYDLSAGVHAAARVLGLGEEFSNYGKPKESAANEAQPDKFGLNDNAPPDKAAESNS